MTIRSLGITALPLLAAVAFLTAASLSCQVPARAAADANGYAGKGQIVVNTSIAGAGTDLTVGADITLEEHGPFLRVDMLSLAIPGVNKTITSLLSTQLLPPGGFTIVYNATAGTYTVWSPSMRAYYTSASVAPPSPAAPPPSGTGAAIGAVGGLFGAFAFASSFKNDSAFSASVSLAGHGVVNGHPATGLDYSYSRTTSAGDTTEIHGRLQLADDLNSVPVEVTASGKSKSFPPSSFRLDLTTLAKTNVPDGDFQVPAGFVHANDLGDVMGRTLLH